MWKRKTKCVKGYTLVECLVALTLNLLIMAMLLEFVLIAQRLYLKQQGMARLQENARLVHYILNHAVKTGRSSGLTRWDTRMPIRDMTRSDTVQSVTGMQWGVSIKALKKSPSNPKRLFQIHRSGTDILRCHSVTQPHVAQFSLERGQPILTLAEPLKLKDKDMIALSDCEQADILEYQAPQYCKERTHWVKALPLSQEVTEHYIHRSHNHLVIGHLKSCLYFIGDTQRVNQLGEPIYALYEHVANGKISERVEGVEELQIAYGIHTKSQVQFVPLEAVTDWREVVAIQFKVCLSSIEPALITSSGNMTLRQWWEYVIPC